MNIDAAIRQNAPVPVYVADAGGGRDHSLQALGGACGSQAGHGASLELLELDCKPHWKVVGKCRRNSFYTPNAPKFPMWSASVTDRKRYGSYIPGWAEKRDVSRFPGWDEAQVQPRDGRLKSLPVHEVMTYSRELFMKRLLLWISLFVLFSSLANADEGMWLYNAFPKDKVQTKYHFEPSQGWLDHVRLSSVRFNNGGSGSFVSANGLTFTNHHVGAECIQ